MTPTISPMTGTLAQQPTAASACNAAAPAPYASTVPTAATPAVATGTAPATAVAAAGGGGAVQAVEGVAAVQGVQGAQAAQPQVAAGGAQLVPGTTATPEQLIPVLQNLVSVLNQLIPILQQQLGGAVSGGGAVTGGGAGCGCGMPGCTHGSGMATQAMQGAMGAPTAPAATRQASDGARATRGGGDGGAHAAPTGNVDPSSVKDKASTNGLTASARRGLDAAHRFGVPLVSGHRTGGLSTSDHPHGRAIDVSTLPIGSPSSTRGTDQMRAYADFMRLEAKAGRMDVKYIIRDGEKASPSTGWEWAPYTYPGESRESLERMKQSNRGNYNRIQHYDHVHVSFNS